MTYSAIAAEGYYQILGMDSSETGQFCRSHGITLEELKEFSAWINANDDIMPASQFRSREKELTQTVAELPKISGFGAVDDVGKRPISLWHKQTPGILGVDFYPDRLYNIL